MTDWISEIPKHIPPTCPWQSVPSSGRETASWFSSSGALPLRVFILCFQNRYIPAVNKDDCVATHLILNSGSGHFSHSGLQNSWEIRKLRKISKPNTRATGNAFIHPCRHQSFGYVFSLAKERMGKTGTFLLLAEDLCWEDQLGNIDISTWIKINYVLYTILSL